MATLTAPLQQASARLSSARRLRVDRAHVVAFAILGLVALIYFYHLATWLIDGDEEGYLYAAWRISLGELPYRDFLTPQLPAFLFPGGLLVHLFGRDPWVMRAWCATLALVAGWATYLTGRRLFGAVAGLTAMTLLLVTNDVFMIARVFRPEAMMLACGALALYVFVRADEHGSRVGYALASLLFGLALLAKLFGVLPWVATAAYVATDGVRGGRGRRRVAGDLVALVLPGTLLVGLVMGGFIWLTRDTLVDTVEHHLRQGAQLTRSQVVQKALVYYWSTVNWHAAVLSLLPAGILAARRLAPRRGMVIVWQVPTVLVFFFLSRELWSRHLVYLIPAIDLLFGAAMGWLVGLRRDDRLLGPVFALGIMSAIILPHLLDDVEDYARAEIGTARLGALISTLAPSDTRILADSAGAGFYAGRATTKTAAGLSEGAAESGQVTGARLRDEMASGNVSLVLLDPVTQSGQLADLVDYPVFEAAVKQGYTPLGRFWRFEQPLDVYLRPDIPQPGLDFGWGKLVGLGLNPSRLAAGDALDVGLVWQVGAPPGGRYTAFLHLVGPDGQTWAVGDSLLDNALFRSTEEWGPGEVISTPLRLTTDPGTPPGRYRLQLGLYDHDSGQRLRWTMPDGRSGDTYDAGEVELVRPDRPPDGGSLDFGTAAATGVSGPYRLLAADLPASLPAGREIPLRLTWQATRAPGAEHLLRLVVSDSQGRRLAESSIAPGGPSWPTTSWRQGEIVTTRSPILVDPTATGGRATVAAGWVDATGADLGEPITLGTIGVEPLPLMETALPTIPRPITATVGADVELLGSNLPYAARPGESLDLTLTWRAHAPVRRSLTTLVHLVNAAGEVVTQADGLPAGGDRPTTSWRAGEVITDTRQLTLPPDLPPGDYTVMAGLYDGQDPDYPRLPVIVDGVARDDGRAPMGAVHVAP